MPASHPECRDILLDRCKRTLRVRDYNKAVEEIYGEHGRREGIIQAGRIQL